MCRLVLAGPMHQHQRTQVHDRHRRLVQHGLPWSVSVSWIFALCLCILASCAAWHVGEANTTSREAACKCGLEVLQAPELWEDACTTYKATGLYFSASSFQHVHYIKFHLTHYTTHVQSASAEDQTNSMVTEMYKKIGMVKDLKVVLDQTGTCEYGNKQLDHWYSSYQGHICVSMQGPNATELVLLRSHMAMHSLPMQPKGWC